MIKKHLPSTFECENVSMQYKISIRFSTFEIDNDSSKTLYGIYIYKEDLVCTDSGLQTYIN